MSSKKKTFKIIRHQCSVTDSNLLKLISPNLANLRVIHTDIHPHLEYPHFLTLKNPNESYPETITYYTEVVL